MAATTYDGFVSYSHAGDAKLAPLLQSSVQRFAKPWYRMRAVRLFRDETALSADPSLWGAVEAALQRSTWFVLLASPEAAASVWVDREVRWWLQHRDPAHVVIVLTDGAMTWHDGVLDRGATTALPPSLVEHLTAAEPRWVDLSWARHAHDRDSALDERDPRFRDAVASIAASLRGLPKDEVFGEDVRQHRRTRRLVRSAVALLTVLTLVSVTLGVVARDQRDTALTTAMTERVDGIRDEDPQEAIRVGAGADMNQPTASSAAGLMETLTGSRYHLSPITQNGSLRQLSFDRRGQRLAASSDTGETKLWDTTDIAAPHMLARIPSTPGDHRDALSPDGMLLASAAPGGTQLWDVSDPSAVHVRAALREGASPIGHAEFSRDGRLLVVADVDGGVWLHDVAALTAPARMVTPPAAAVTNAVSDLGISADSRTLAVSNFSSSVRLWDITDPTAPRPLPPVAAFTSTTITALAWSPASRTLGLGDVRGQLSAVDETDPTTPRPRGSTSLSAAPITAVSFRDDGKFVAASSLDHTVSLARVDELSGPEGDTLGRHLSAVLDAAFLPGRATVVSADDAGQCVRWDDTGTGRPVLLGPPTVVPNSPGGFASLAVIGSTALTGGTDGLVRRWSVDAVGTRRLQESGPPIPVPVGAVRSLVATPDGRSVVVGGDLGAVALVDLAAGRASPPTPAHRGAIIAMALTPDGTRLVTSGTDLRARVWDLRGPGGPRPIRELAENNALVPAIAITGDGRTVATGRSDSRTTLYDLGLTEPVTPPLAPLGTPLGGHYGSVTQTRFSSSGELAIGGADGRTTLWDLRDPASPRPMPDLVVSGEGPAGAVVFSVPETDVLAVGDGDGMQIEDVGDQTRTRALGPLLPAGGQVTAAGITADRRVLIIATDSGTLVGYDLTSLTTLRRDRLRVACARAGSPASTDEDTWSARPPPTAPEECASQPDR